MAVAIQHKKTIFHTDTIIIGYAQLVAVIKEGTTYWELPGGLSTTSRNFATDYARKLNQVIISNMLRSKRSLI